MKQQILEQMPDANLQVYVVWGQVLSRMSPEALAGASRSAARRISGPRVRHFLDPELVLMMPYGEVIGLPENEPAWDVYFVFAPEVRWEQVLPVPTKWMHQRGSGPPEDYLDLQGLADTVQQLLAETAER